MRKRSIVVGGGAFATLLALVVGLPLYAAADLTADFGRTVDFEPLVRHMMSQVHCYDTGTDDCEDTHHFGNSFTKEHTLGFLLDGSRRKMSERGFEPLYVCESRDDSGVMMVTSGVTEEDPRRACRNEGFRARQAGYISSSDQIEAPSALYRCMHPDTHDTLLTHDPTECAAQAYDAAELLGYLYAGGPLSLE
jgi:hypothetical protein